MFMMMGRWRQHGFGLRCNLAGPRKFPFVLCHKEWAPLRINMLSADRAIHISTLLVIFITAILACEFVPELWTGANNKFSTLSGFATLYGVIFAAIEVVRARAASDLASAAAVSTHRAVISAIDVKTLGECKAYIINCLTDLERDGWASTSVLVRIIDLYTSQFHAVYDLPESPQRIAVAALQSHAASASGPLKGRALKNLKTTLTDMLIHVTSASGEKLSEKKS